MLNFDFFFDFYCLIFLLPLIMYLLVYLKATDMILSIIVDSPLSYSTKERASMKPWSFIGMLISYKSYDFNFFHQDIELLRLLNSFWDYHVSDRV